MFFGDVEVTTTAWSRPSCRAVRRTASNVDRISRACADGGCATSPETVAIADARAAAGAQEKLLARTPAWHFSLACAVLF